MPVDYAVALTRQYSQFIKVPGDSQPVKLAHWTRPVLVASGPDAEDYRWTEVMMRDAGAFIDALSLHYYTIPDSKDAFGSGTDFDEASYARTLSKTLLMDQLITAHAAIMDKYDPGKRVSLAIDEWGILTDVVAGHDPRSLFMQNSLRDALLATLNFDIFIRHADRVRMASITGMINVCQSMILTAGTRMIVTPTYYAYEMYVPFQDATYLPIDIRTPQYSKAEWAMPAVSGVAARGKDGVVRIALTNVDPQHAVKLDIRIKDMTANTVTGRVLTSARGVTAHNDFDAPDVVRPRLFSSARIVDGVLSVELLPHSLTRLDLR
jgi:alpha-N-arabinofuranosidase